MLNCKQAAQLISQELDRPLGISERLALGFHLMMCAGCRNFEKQMSFLRRACRIFPGRSGSDEEQDQ